MNVSRVAEIDDMRRCVDLEDAVFSEKNSDASEVVRLLPIIIEVEVVNEVIRVFVMMRIPATVSFKIEKN